VWLVRLD